MQPTTETPKQYQCRHIFADGRRCSSPCLRQQEFCYYHHTTRRPVANPRQRRTRRSTFHLPLPEDRSAIQASIGEVLQRIAANEIDPRRAGLLLYGLQIASLNLPKPPAHRNAKPEPVEFVQEITTDPELGILAPRTEVSDKTERKSTVAKLIERIMQGDPPPAPAERVIQSEQQPAPTPEPATIPTLQATADNLHNMHQRTKKASSRRQTFLSRRQPKEASSRPDPERSRGGSGGTPHSLLPMLVLSTRTQRISFRPERNAVEKSASPQHHPPSQKRHFDRRRRTCRRSGEIRFSTSALSQSRHNHSWLLYPIPASTPRI